MLLKQSTGIIVYFSAFLLIFAFFSGLFCPTSADTRDSVEPAFHAGIHSLRQYTNHIIAFGDSLTQGLDPNIMGWHSYTIELTKLMGTDVIVDMEGVSGERTDEMITRLAKIVDKQKVIGWNTRPNGHNGHDRRVVVILGGTNDLGAKKSTEYIYENLLKMHKMVTELNQFHSNKGLNRKVYSIAVTIPDCVWSIDQNVRKEVNQKLKDLAANSDSVYLFDLEAKTLQSNKTNSPFWGKDLVHYNSFGYDNFGNMLYNFLETTKLKE